jgi:hypothetical protein
MTNRTLGLLLSIVWGLIIFLFVLYLAVKDGVLGLLLLGLAVVLVIIAVSFDKFAHGFRTLVEAFTIRGAARYSRTEKNGHTFTVERGNYLPPAPLQIAAPPSYTPNLDAQKLPASLTDPRRNAGLALLSATVNDPDYGPNSTKIMTQTRAIEKHVVTNGDEHQAAVGYLCDYFAVQTVTDRGSNNGTFIRSGKTAGQVLLDTAIWSTPPATPAPAQVNRKRRID